MTPPRSPSNPEEARDKFGRFVKRGQKKRADRKKPIRGVAGRFATPTPFGAFEVLAELLGGWTVLETGPDDTKLARAERAWLLEGSRVGHEEAAIAVRRWLSLGWVKRVLANIPRLHTAGRFAEDEDAEGEWTSHTFAIAGDDAMNSLLESLEGWPEEESAYRGSGFDAFDFRSLMLSLQAHARRGA